MRKAFPPLLNSLSSQLFSYATHPGIIPLEFPLLFFSLVAPRTKPSFPQLLVFVQGRDTQEAAR